MWRGGPAADEIEILLVHPGGPFWAKKDTHGWSVPKGEYDEGEDPEAAAAREFAEELGHPLPDGERVDLGEIRASSKLIRAWAVKGDLNVENVDSNTFEMEWPPRSGVMQAFPEVDRAGWFSLAEAATKLHKGQVPLIERIRASLGG